MNKVTKKLLEMVSDLVGDPTGAYNIREDGQCAGRQSTEHIQINPKKDKPGIDIIIQPEAKGETVYIPACVTHSHVDDLVYNDFYVGEGADVTIVAGIVFGKTYRDRGRNGRTDYQPPDLRGNRRGRLYGNEQHTDQGCGFYQPYHKSKA